MTEPTSTAVSLANFTAYVAVSLAGYITGDTVTIILGATIGALWAIGAAETKSRLDAVVLLVKLVGTALALTGFLTYLIETSGGVPAAKTLVPTAFFVAAIGPRWPEVINAVVDGLLKVVGGLMKAGAKRVGLPIGEDQ